MLIFLLLQVEHYNKADNMSYLQFYYESHKVEQWLAVRVNILTSMFEDLQITEESVLKELVNKLKV